MWILAAALSISRRSSRGAATPDRLGRRAGLADCARDVALRLQAPDSAPSAILVFMRMTHGIAKCTYYTGIDAFTRKRLCIRSRRRSDR